MQPNLWPSKDTRCQPRILPERNELKAPKGSAEDLALPPGDQKNVTLAELQNLLEENHMRKLLPCLSSILLAVLPFFAEVTSASDQTKDDDRLRNCGTVLKEILDVPDDIPQDLLDKADCVVVFPSVLKAAFIVGGSYGRGAMSDQRRSSELVQALLKARLQAELQGARLSTKRDCPPLEIT